jgi:hypothetical protein
MNIWPNAPICCVISADIPKPTAEAEISSVKRTSSGYDVKLDGSDSIDCDEAVWTIK